MTPKLLKAAGVALYGERWMTELARALHVEYSTIRRWYVRNPKRGGFAMSEETDAKIAELCWRKMLRLDAIRDAIRDGISLATDAQIDVGPTNPSGDPHPAPPSSH